MAVVGAAQAQPTPTTTPTTVAVITPPPVPVTVAVTVQAPAPQTGWAEPRDLIGMGGVLVALAALVFTDRQRKADRRHARELREDDHRRQRELLEDERREQRRRDVAPAVGAVHSLLDDAEPNRLAGSPQRLAEIRSRWESEVAPRLSAVIVEFPSLAERRLAGQLSREVRLLLDTVEDGRSDEASAHYESALSLRNELGAAVRGAMRTVSGKLVPSYTDMPVENQTPPEMGG